MQRRTFLMVTSASLVGLAGCASDEPEQVGDNTTTTEVTTTASDAGGDGDQTDSTETETEMETETETETETPTGEASVSIESKELVVNEGEYSTDVYVAAKIVNSGEAPSGTIRLSAEWYDAEGNYLDNTGATLRTLGAGETWAARVYAYSTDAEKIEDFELSGEFASESPDFSPNGLEVTESELKVGERDAAVTGGVENQRGEKVDYIQAIAKFYDADGVVLGTGRDNVTGVPADRTWSFEASWLGRSDRFGEIEDYQLVISDSVF